MRLLTRTLVALSCLLACHVAQAQSPTPPPGPPPGAPGGAGAPPFSGPPNGSYAIPTGAGTVKDPANLPDFSGVWGRAEGFTHPDQTKIIPFMTEQAAADFKKHIAAHDFHVPWSDCEPTAFPAMITEMGMPIEFLMTPGRVTMIVPDGEVHNVWTDGSRPFATPPGGTYYGNAVGHWEGQTLVVTTTGLRPDNDVVMGLTAGTDDMKVVERLSLMKDGRLRDQLTVTGPAYLAKPYRYTQYFKRLPGIRLAEFVCLASKNRDNGTSLDLTPPP